MTDERPSMHAAIRDWAAAAREGLGAPPSAEELEAYRRGDLSEARHSEVRRHLVLDPEQTQRFLDESGDMVSTEHEQAVDDLVGVLLEVGVDENALRLVERGIHRNRRSWRSVWMHSWVRFAAMAVLAFGLGWVLASSWPAPEIGGEPSIVGPAPEFLELAIRHRGGDGSQMVRGGRVELGEGPVLVGLSLLDSTDAKQYSVELAARNDGFVERVEVERRDDGSVRFLLNPAGLERGTYNLHLWAHSRSEDELLGSTTLEVVASP
ncbi:MAG: hypothetical protein AAGC60_24590 [Acidobacteriota bacterium]